jgi:hypothetical protein
MIEVLEQYLTQPKEACVVGKWEQNLNPKEQEAFAKLKENNANINVGKLFKDLNTDTKLPFRLTAFRSHMRGYCTCL